MNNFGERANKLLIRLAALSPAEALSSWDSIRNSLYDVFFLGSRGHDVGGGVLVQVALYGDRYCAQDYADRHGFDHMDTTWLAEKIIEALYDEGAARLIMFPSKPGNDPSRHVPDPPLTDPPGWFVRFWTFPKVKGLAGEAPADDGIAVFE